MINALYIHSHRFINLKSELYKFHNFTTFNWEILILVTYDKQNCVHDAVERDTPKVITDYSSIYIRKSETVE